MQFILYNSYSVVKVNTFDLCSETQKINFIEIMNNFKFAFLVFFVDHYNILDFIYRLLVNKNETEFKNIWFFAMLISENIDLYIDWDFYNKLKLESPSSLFGVALLIKMFML